MKKRLLVLFAFVTVFMVMAFSAVSVEAAKYGDLTYYVSDGEVEISDCSTSVTGTVTIPSTIEGYPVTEIDSFAFSECVNMTGVVIPKSVKLIDTYAFYKCSSLTSIKIPYGVTSIGHNAFSNCTSLQGVSIADSVTSIGETTFFQCTALTSVRLPSSIKTIPRDMFWACTSLQSINIPEGVTRIEYDAFSGCSGLTSVVLPSTISSVSYDAFYNCNNLQNVYFRGTSAQWSKLYVSNSKINNATVTCDYVDPAKEGWVEDGAETYFYEKGVMLKNAWRKDSKDWRYLGAEGYAVANQWISDSTGSWCYVGSDGYMVRNTFVKDSKGLAYLNANGYFTYVSKWVQQGADWYYVKSGYAIKNCWLYSNGWYRFDENGKMMSNEWAWDVKGWCYLGASGKMVTKSWISDSTGKWCYVGNDGYMVKNQWVSDSTGGWCYVGNDGYMVTNTVVKDSKGYAYINAKGYFTRATQWAELNSNWYYIQNGYAATNTWKQDKNGWCYLGGSGAMLKNSWLQYGGYWYYFNSNGYMVSNGIKGIDGSIYNFRADGTMIANESYGGGYIPASGKMPDTCFSYLAGSLFRSERSKYSYAIARGAHVKGYVGADGNVYVVVDVRFVIGTNNTIFSEVRLYDITRGKTISNPESHFDSLAKSYVGSTKLMYMRLKTQYLGAHSSALQFFLDNGYYRVSASYLNY